MQTTWIPSGRLGITWFAILTMYYITVHAQEPSSAQTPVLAAVITEDSPTLSAEEMKPGSPSAHLLLSVGDLEEDA